MRSRCVVSRYLPNLAERQIQTLRQANSVLPLAAFKGKEIKVNSTAAVLRYTVPLPRSGKANEEVVLDIVWWR